jgi:hypothetical protein
MPPPIARFYEIAPARAASQFFIAHSGESINSGPLAAEITRKKGFADSIFYKKELSQRHETNSQRLR